MKTDKNEDVTVNVDFLARALVVVETARNLYGPIEDPDGEPCDHTGECDLCAFEQALLQYDKIVQKMKDKRQK